MDLSKSTHTIRGAGMLQSPEITVNMPNHVYDSASEARREENYRQVEEVARANNFTHATISHWNHDTQVVHDARGRRIRYYDPAAGAMRSRSAPADEHITCCFRNVAKPFELVRAHVYVVAGQSWIPVGQMLKAARRYPGPGDVDSPQFWKCDLRRRVPLGDADGLTNTDSSRSDPDKAMKDADSSGRDSDADVMDTDSSQASQSDPDTDITDSDSSEPESEAWPENIDLLHYEDPMEILPFEVQRWLQRRIQAEANKNVEPYADDEYEPQYDNPMDDPVYSPSSMDTSQ